MMSGLKQRSSNGAAADSLLEARMHASMRAVDSMCGAEKALTLSLRVVSLLLNSK